MICGVLLAVVLIILLAAPVTGISIPLDGFRHPIESAATRVLDRQVHIQGALALRPGIIPTLDAHDVRIAGQTGQGDLLRAGRITVRLAPVALLRGEPRSRRVLIEDASIDLAARETVAHGTGRAEPGEANAVASHPLLSETAALLVRQPELQELVLRRVVLHDRNGGTGLPYPIRLDEVSVDNRPGQALALMLQGRFQQQPYTIDLTGGRLADLLTPATPWPLQARLSFANIRLLLNGHLETSPQGQAMRFELQADWPAEFARLAAHLGQVPLPGRLSLHTDQGRPVVAGELQLPALDAVLRLGTGAGPARDTTAQPVSGSAALTDRPVSVPLTLDIADVPFHGQLIVAGQATGAGLELALSATDASAGPLLEALTGTTGIRGRFRHIGFQATARGGSETGMVNRTALALQVEGARLSYGNTDGGRPVAVTLDELAMSLPAGKTLTMHAQGHLLEESFALEFTAGGLGALLQEGSWPVKLSATGGGAVLDVSGPLAVADSHSPTRLHVGLYGQRIGDLAAWLGVSPCAATPYTLRGELVLTEDIGRLEFLQVQTDTTRLNGELDWSGDEQIALLHAVLQFEQLDPADIETLIPLVSLASDEDAPRGIAIDMPVLPARLEIINADIDLDIAHILLSLMDISEVSLTAEIRNGRLQRSPFHAHIGNASFRGYLDPASAETGVVFEDEDDDNAAGGRMGKLFSSAVRWAGSNAVVPLRWIFRKKFSGGDPAECRDQGAKSGK